jgi:chemotaxis protein CheD
MNQIIVSIAEMAVSDNPDDVLVTYSLGSCLGVTFYDPDRRIGGMIHCMLPLSQYALDKAQQNPFMFVDTGVPKLLTKMFSMGCEKKKVVTRLAGSANVLDDKGLFRIGERNYAVCRKILWKNSMLIAAEDIGGHASRTLRLEIGTGRVIVKSAGMETIL